MTQKHGSEVMCCCGQPLHYAAREQFESVQQIVETQGEMIPVRIYNQTTGYLVPRHYIALHGLRATDIKLLAIKYGWKKIEERKTREMTEKTLGEIGYEAYRAHTDGKSLISGAPIPDFRKLSAPIQEAWEKAGQAVAASVGRADAISGEVA